MFWFVVAVVVALVAAYAWWDSGAGRAPARRIPSEQPEDFSTRRGLNLENPHTSSSCQQTGFDARMGF